MSSPFRTALLVCVSALVAAAAQAHNSKADDATEYRMGLMTVFEWNFGPLGAMVKGKQPFDVAEFEKRAQRLASLSDQVLEGFPKGSEQGEHTSAKAAIWANFDDFSTKAKTFQTEAQALAEVSHAHDEAKDREQFRKVAQACKACHEKYKND